MQKVFPKAFKVEGYFPGYDVVIPETDERWEVKEDFMARKTGNYFIESKCLEETKATHWVIIDGEKAVRVGVSTLKELVKDLPEKVSPPKGKDGERKGKLLPCQTLYK